MSYKKEKERENDLLDETEALPIPITKNPKKLKRLLILGAVANVVNILVLLGVAIFFASYDWRGALGIDRVEQHLETLIGSLDDKMQIALNIASQFGFNITGGT